MTDLCYLSATDALRMFAARELSPVELVEAVLARAEAGRADDQRLRRDLPRPCAEAGAGGRGAVRADRARARGRSRGCRSR